MIYHCVVLNIAQFCALYCTLSAGFATMSGLKNTSDCFAYTIDSKEGGYVLNITNAAAILIRDEMTGDFAAGVLRVIPISKIITKTCLNPIFLEGMSEYHTIPHRFGPVASRQE